MVKMLRLLKGYVSFEVWGGFPERFLNLCKLKNVNLHSLETDGDKICASTDIGGFSRIGEIAERSGMSVKATSERGLPFFVKRHRYRCGAVVGMILVVFFIAFMSGFVWQVEVVGEDSETNARLESDLRELGVYSGARKSKVDILQVQEEILLLHEDINWVSLNIFGTKARVEYTPVKEKLPISDTTSPVNIVAEKKGRITLVECYNGTKTVKEGDYVSAGDLLISGVIANADGSEKIAHASGKVFAKTENEHKYKSYVKADRYIINATDTSYSLNLFGLKIPVGKGVREDKESEVFINIKGNETELPVGLIRYDGFSCKRQSIALTEHQATLMCVSEAITERRRKYSDAEIEKLTFDAKKTDNGFIITESIICVENIGKEEEFYIEKN